MSYLYLKIRQPDPVEERVCLLPGLEDENDLVVRVLGVMLLQEIYEAVIHPGQEAVGITSDGVHEDGVLEEEGRALLGQTDLVRQVGPLQGQLERDDRSGHTLQS